VKKCAIGFDREERRGKERREEFLERRKIGREVRRGPGLFDSGS